MNFRYLILFLVFVFQINSAFAFTYSNSDKDMFYEAFLEGYFTEMEKSVNQLDIEPEKKTEFLSALKKRTNKQDLINSSWNCIQNYPISQIVAASVICTTEWTSLQFENNKDLFELLK